MELWTSNLLEKKEKDRKCNFKITSINISLNIEKKKFTNIKKNVKYIFFKLYLDTINSKFELFGSVLCF